MADSPIISSPRDKRKWSIIRTQQTEGPPYRSCHTANIYKTQMIVRFLANYLTKVFVSRVYQIFGGISAKQNKLCDIYSLDLSEEEWCEIKPKVNTPNLTRYCHAAEIYKTQLIIMGGIGEDGGRRNDVKVLDLETRDWIDPQIHGQLPVPRRYRLFLLLWHVSICNTTYIF